MQKHRRLVLGILVGGCCGAALVAAILPFLPEARFHRDNVASLYYLIFGKFAYTHWIAVSIILGSLVGALLGGLLLGKSPVQRTTFALVLAFLAGVAVGDARALHGARMVLKDDEAMWENLASQNEALAALLGLQALESGDPNRVERFKTYGRNALSHYIRQADQLSTGTYSGFVATDWFTNAPTYKKAKKFLTQP